MKFNFKDLSDTTAIGRNNPKNNVDIIIRINFWTITISNGDRSINNECKFFKVCTSNTIQPHCYHQRVFPFGLYVGSVVSPQTVENR